jgi:hypothetical protein
MFSSVELDWPCNSDVSDDVNIMLNNGCVLFDMYVCTSCFVGAPCSCGDSATETGLPQTVDNIQNDTSAV